MHVLRKDIDWSSDRISRGRVQSLSAFYLVNLERVAAIGHRLEFRSCFKTWQSKVCIMFHVYIRETKERLGLVLIFSMAVEVDVIVDV